MVTADTDRDRDGEGEKDSERHGSDLYIRTGWADATTAFEQLEKGKAKGDRWPLWVRARLQQHLRSFGTFLESHAGKVLFVSLLVMSTFCVGLKSTTFHSSIDQLWVASTDLPALSFDQDGPSTSSASSSHFNQPQQNTVDLLSTHQMVVQTSADPDANLLHARGLLEHLTLVQQATQVAVNVFDQTWRLKDLCQSPSIPNYDIHFIEQIFDNIMPCSIITPLDCFWEGSKLLGPDYPVNIPGVGSKVKWTNLNPTQIVQDIKKMEFNFDYHTLENYLRRGGITTAYQEKPCLNPKDPECPDTAPNKNSTQIPDIGAELTSGCYGFAAKYMHWPEDLLVGGAVKNKTGHIRQAKALQTVVQLMDGHEMFEFWKDTYKTHHVSWSKEKAAVVLDMWQKKFAQEIKQLTLNNITSPSYHFNAFSTATLNDMLKQHLHYNIWKLGAVLVLLLVYSVIADSFVAALGVLLLVGSTAAGVGLCSVLGFPMNVLSVHILPYLSVGLGMRDVYLLLNTYHKCQQTSESVKRTALNVLATALINAMAFCTAAIVPIPALRVFALECAILVVFNTGALVFVIPALMSLESRCKKSAFFCCSEVSSKLTQINNNNDHSKNLLHAELICRKRHTHMASLLSRYLTSVILNPVIRFILFVAYAILIVFFILNGLKVEYDIRLSMFLPRGTQEYNYLESQNKYFGFYSFYLVTSEFEYPQNQKLLYEYHQSLAKVPTVLKDSNGGLNMNDFWLANFRDFLLDLQDEFDNNLAKNCLNSEKWFPNATEKAVLAFKLLSQTGVVEFPVDKTVILKKRLVTEGIIDSNAFYNYLSVWSSNDQLSYSSSKSNLSPKPFQYYSSKTEFDLKIPKSQPLVYTQMPFYLKNLKTTSKIVDTLKQIRAISERYNNRGLKNYPLGLIFAYFDQFLNLNLLLAGQLIIVFCFTTLVSGCLLLKWTKVWSNVFSIVISMLMLSIVNISSMSAIFIALHWVLVGRNVSLILTGYVSAIGNKERRVKLSLDLYCCAILKGDIALCLCVCVWFFSEFDFIKIHLLYVTVACLLTALINGLVFLPILLSVFGPSAEVVPLVYSDRIATPPPVSSPVASRQQYNSSVSNSSSKPPRRSQPSTKATREPSLTTITEESCNQSIVVQPEVVVEYSNPNDSGSSSSGQYTTKVTATTNIKVEVMAPMYRERSRHREHRNDSRDDRPTCHSHRVVCSEKRKSSSKCKDDSDSSRSSRSTRRCDRRDDCQHRDRDRERDRERERDRVRERDRESSCRHSCWDDDRDWPSRHSCDSSNDKRGRSARSRRDSDSSDSDSDKDRDRCWVEQERSTKTASNSSTDESSSTSSSISSCIKINDHEQS